MANYDTPKTLDGAIGYLYSGMTAKERRDFAWWGPVAFHSSLGRQIRNEWGLWTGSPLKRHFNEVFGLGHADDMTGMILDGLEARINGTEFDPKAKAEGYQRYWLRMFIDPLSQKEIVFLNYTLIWCDYTNSTYEKEYWEWNSDELFNEWVKVRLDPDTLFACVIGKPEDEQKYGVVMSYVKP